MAAEEEWKAALLSEEKEEWRAELLAPVEEDWKALLMLRHVKRDERWRVKLVAPLKVEWQVKMVLFAPEVWKAEMIASLKPDQEMRARELLECSTKNFADEVRSPLISSHFTTLCRWRPDLPTSTTPKFGNDYDSQLFVRPPYSIYTIVTIVTIVTLIV